MTVELPTFSGAPAAVVAELSTDTVAPDDAIDTETLGASAAPELTTAAGVVAPLAGTCTV